MNDNEICLSLGSRVRALRLAKGWSQEELGARANLDRTYVSGIERGVRNPTVTVLHALSEGLGIGIGDLFADANEIIK
ncbi:helix-turn-helix domain-containing protein [Pseudomonas sp. IT-P2]|uniref:helix-turn-helix domain-containing protein n=1 Tax=Pseudomonas sp. IT-P2 TaxID=3026456 RepID=UPI0039E09C89